MVEPLIITKSKDSNNINYSFTTQLDMDKDDLAKSIFSSPLFKLSYNSGLTYIAIGQLLLTNKASSLSREDQRKS